MARHYAAKENLKIDFRIEGSVFTNLTVRNLHAVAAGASEIESIDADYAQADYDLWRLLRHDIAGAFRNIEVRSARIVMNPANAPSKARSPKVDTKLRLPGVFPERLRLSDVDLVVRNQPHDFVIEHVDLDLNPRAPGELRIEKLQLPIAPAWSKISARTSYANRNLVLRDLVLSSDERIGLLSIDAARIKEKKLAVNLEAAIGNGKLSASLALTEARSSLNTEAHLRIENVAAEALPKYLGLSEAMVQGEIVRLTMDGTGVLNAPKTWSGKAAAQIRNFRESGIFFDRVDLQVSARDGAATLQAADLAHAQNEFHVRGSAELPDDIRQFGRSPLALELTGAVVDLHALTASSAEPLSGSAQITGKIDVVGGKLQARLNASADSIGFKDGKIGKLNMTIKADRIMPPPKATKPWFADLRSEIALTASEMRYRDYIFDSIDGSLIGIGGLLSVDRLVARRKQNKLNVRGRYRLPEDLSKFSAQPEQMEIALNAPELGDFWISESDNQMSGPLQVAGQFEWKNGLADGQLSIFGAKVQMRDLVFNQVSAQCSIARNVVYVNDFTASLNEHDFVSANGIVDLRAPFHYTGKIAANIADLATLQPLLSASGNEKELAGSLAINWEGTGERKISKSSGKMNLTLKEGRYGDLQSLEANVDASYSPDGVDVPIVFFRNDKMYFQANATAKGERLEISKIQLDQQNAKYAAGYISIPFVWKNLGTEQTVCPPNGKVVATFQSEKIDIKKLFADIGLKPLASGVLNIKLDASGTIADLNARLDLRLENVRSENLPKLEPATFDLTAQAQHDRLSILGKLQQSQIQPAELTASLPFDIPKIARARQLPEETPLQAKLRLPRSPVKLIREFVPAFHELDGDVVLDVDLGGTIGQPRFSGAGDITINGARFENPTLPAVHDFKARLKFADNALRLEQFGGELAGGHFTMTGRVTFPKLTSANLDLQLKADSVLVARNDDLTARADADLKITGPFTTATVTGNAALTNSKFLKNLDLIPIGLPGRPAPRATERPEIRLFQPPLRDWKFDVSLKTKDPFLIRGNLANGGATGELHLTGTGLHPALQGTVRLEKVEATLPFSRLEISDGFLYFDPSDSFNPRIEFHGTSVIRDYIVHVYVYGTSLAPEAVFTSEPPLPQEEIISLLAAGTTRSELAGSSDVVAGRAAMLLVQQLYRKVFKKGEATQSNSIFDRLDVSFGAVDPRTGQRRANASLRINDQFFVLGDLNVGGDYRGMLKYVIRFR
jgi:hypothetical protein